MTQTRDRIIAEYHDACKLFALVAGDDGCTEGQWRMAWTHAEECRAALFGVPPREPDPKAFKRRHSCDLARVVHHEDGPTETVKRASARGGRNATETKRGRASKGALAAQG